MRRTRSPEVDPADEQLTADVIRTVQAERESQVCLCARLVAAPSASLAELDSGRLGPHLVHDVDLDTMPPGDLRLPPSSSADEAEHLARETVAHLDGVSVTRIEGWDANWTTTDSTLARAFAAADLAATGSPPTYAIRLPASDASRGRRLGVLGLCHGRSRRCPPVSTTMARKTRSFDVSRSTY